MKKILSIFMGTLMFPLFCVGDAMDGTVLYWMVDDPHVYELDGTDLFVSELTSRPDGLQVNAVRLKVANVNGDDIYLGFIEGNGSTVSMVEYDDSWTPPAAYSGPHWTGMDGFTEDSVEYLFQAELGNYNFNTGDWTIMAVSDPETYESLKKFMNTDPLYDPGYGYWSPNFSVPEPSSLLMCMIGIGVLMLKRRKVKQ